MIHILIGDDTKNKSLFIKELVAGRESSFLLSSDISRDILMNYCFSTSLFGDVPAIILENVFKEGDIIFSTKDLESLKESDATFIFKEDKMLAIDQKKYKKYGDIKVFENPKVIVKEKFNTFQITDAYANRDKITTWTLYRKGIEGGVEPEAIAGLLFWKMKTMILSSSRVFSKDELKRNSSSIVSIYHKAHRGEVDFILGLEQFILSSLSSK